MSDVRDVQGASETKNEKKQHLIAFHTYDNDGGKSKGSAQILQTLNENKQKKYYSIFVMKMKLPAQFFCSLSVYLSWNFFLLFHCLSLSSQRTLRDGSHRLCVSVDFAKIELM